jgi:hypothetical protein
MGLQLSVGSSPRVPPKYSMFLPLGGIIKRGQPQDVKYLVDPGQKKLQVVSYERWGDRTNELVQTYNKLIMREGHQ